MDFKERFGLDYLTSKRVPDAPNSASRGIESALPPGLQDALLAYGGKVMDALNRAPNQTMKLFDIAKQLTTRIDTLYPVMNFLVERGYSERTPDPLGNDV